MKLTQKHVPQIPNPQDVRDKLLEIARSDNILSEDEGLIIDRIAKDINKYLQIIDLALSDGELEDQERLQIFNARMEVMTKAVQQAKNDDQITEDEIALLQALMDFLNKMDMTLSKESLGTK